MFYKISKKFLCTLNEEVVKSYAENIKDNKKIILVWDIFSFKEGESSMNEDFVDDELNISNNIHRNSSFDRYIQFYQVRSKLKIKFVSAW